MTLAPRLRALLPAPGAPRVFALSQLVDSLGTGLWLTCSVVFFIHSVGLPAVQVGTGIAVAGLAGFVAGPLFGELWHSAGGFTISMDLAPEHALGAYQGVFGLSSAIHSSVGPALVTALAIGWGGPGWLILAAFSAGLGLLARPLTAWAMRRRPVGVLQPA